MVDVNDVVRKGDGNEERISRTIVGLYDAGGLYY
jgi:hypothetical protein